MNRDYFDARDLEDDERNVKVKGRKESRRAAKKELLDLTPFTGQIEIPYDLHGFIIGRKGSDVSSMMKQYDVNIIIPSKNDHSDTITIKGTTLAKVEQAKAALRRRIEQHERETKDRLLRSFQLTVDVDPQHYPKIIGCGGTTVNKIRQDYNVKINFPKSGRTVTITGHEKDAKDARYAILKFVQKQEDMHKEKVQIDPSIYPRMIGSRGHNILKIRELYKVEIAFPRPSDPEPDLVIIQGAEEDVMNVKGYLLNLQEEYLQDLKQRGLMRQYSRNETQDANSTGDKNKDAEAPDTTTTLEFSPCGSEGNIPSEPED